MALTENLPSRSKNGAQSNAKMVDSEAATSILGVIPEISAAATQKVQQITDKLAVATTPFGEKVGLCSEKLHIAHQKMIDECRTQVRKQPMKAVLIALGVGVALTQLLATVRKK